MTSKKTSASSSRWPTSFTSQGALGALGALEQQTQARIARAIDELADAPRPRGVKKLKGGTGYRIRVGDYRVIYEIDDNANALTVTVIAHRKDAYR